MFKGTLVTLFKVEKGGIYIVSPLPGYHEYLLNVRSHLNFGPQMGDIKPHEGAS